MLKFKLLVLFLSFFLLPQFAMAKIGVGVGTGKIEVDEILVPGSYYNLPNIPVINTGDTETTYSLNIAYHEGQEQLMPDKKWFTFSPGVFSLQPLQSKLVETKLNLPMNAEPGLYFAYVEAQPHIKDTTGQTKVGVSAATKLYFAVAPANWRLAMYFKIKTFLKVYSPWPQRTFIVLLVLALLLVLRRFLKLEIGLKKK